MSVDPTLSAALEPVRRALLAAAAAENARVLADVDAQAAVEIAAARSRADAAVARARAEGAADAAIALAGARARARRRARATVLRAHRQSYLRLREASRAAARRLLDQPGYANLPDRLAAAAVAAVARLEPGAAGHAVPGGTVGSIVTRNAGGGVVAEAAGRRVDYSLDGFADRAVDELGPDLEVLWQP